MSSISVKIEQQGQETQEACPCCGRPIYLGHGVLASAEKELADYWYRWPEGHGKQFMIAISRCDDEGGAVGRGRGNLGSR